MSGNPQELRYCRRTQQRSIQDLCSRRRPKSSNDLCPHYDSHQLGSEHPVLGRLTSDSVNYRLQRTRTALTGGIARLERQAVHVEVQPNDVPLTPVRICLRVRRPAVTIDESGVEVVQHICPNLPDYCVDREAWSVSSCKEEKKPRRYERLNRSDVFKLP